MKTRTFLAVSGIVAILFGLEFLLAPEFAIKQYGVPTEAHNLMQGRYFGGTLLAFGAILWLARGTQDDDTVRALLLGSVVGNLVGAVLSAWSGLAGLQNAMAWFSVAIYGVFLLAAIYLLFTSVRRASPVSA
jgi:nitrate reductase gamma subunit